MFFSLIGTLIFFLNNSVNASCLEQITPLYEQGKLYFSHKQYLLAAHQLSSFSLLSCDKAAIKEARLYWAKSLFELNEFAEADAVIRPLSNDDNYKSKVRIIRAWYQPDSTLDLSQQEREIQSVD